MLKVEKNFDFREELLVLHKPNITDTNAICAEDEFAFTDGVKILVTCPENKVVMNAVRDFQEFMFNSMEIGVSAVRKGETNVKVCLGKDLGEAEGYMGYRITTTKDGLVLEGHDDRGIAQGLYYLEDLMKMRKAPFIKVGVVARKALFHHRNTTSAFGMDEWCDEALQLASHYGFDNITVNMKDPWTTRAGQKAELRLLTERAEKYGIDVCVMYSTPHSKHPDDEGAQEFYDNLYAKLFEIAPKLAGVTVVGESTGFPSKDPRVGLSPYSKNFVDNIPTGKTTPGWYPCMDYPQWLEMIIKSVRSVKPTAEVTFSTYNWGYQPEKERLELIRNLPTDIILHITWDMFHQFSIGDSVADICDYSLRFPGPGEYFVSEAKVAKERGIKVVANAQVSGRTWDFGTVPYEPMPEQWIKRYKNIINSREEYNIYGVVENIHYGFYPSFILDLEKQAFFTEVEPIEETLRKLLERDFGKEQAKEVKKATEKFSEAITHYVPTNEDQYGAYRTGPQYPFWSGDLDGLPASIPEQGKMPSAPHSRFGNYIYFGKYTLDYEARNSLPGVRIYDELNETKILERLLDEGIKILEGIKDKNEKLEKLILLGKFMRNSCRTVIGIKEHFILKQKLTIVGSKEEAGKIIDELEAVVLREKENVLDTIPVVEQDSRLGWEPSMEYTTDRKGLEWKLRQLDYELNFKIPSYRKANSIEA